MEEKKFDLNSLIAFVLLGAIMIWWMYTNQPTPEELAAQKAKTEQVEKAASTEIKKELDELYTIPDKAFDLSDLFKENYLQPDVVQYLLCRLKTNLCRQSSAHRRKAHHFRCNRILRRVHQNWR